jgi:hypothetical protein
MIITKHVESAIKQDYFFITGTILDINHKTKNRINDGIEKNAISFNLRAIEENNG